MKFCYLKPVGWNGFTEGAESGIYAVAPLARLNVA
jgi:F420-non-reducing hydrogenase large subunit